MILHEVAFGLVDKKNRADAENLVESYLAALLHNGQASGQYYIITKNRTLTAYVNLAGMQATSPKYHSEWGKSDLKKVTEFFGNSPQWMLLGDEAPKRETTWRNAPFLYLSTHMFDYESPLCRGDNGKPIPVYRLPITYRDREAIYGWQCSYREYDSIWIDSGELETPAYKQLADPCRELAQRGMGICKAIAKATGIPTYYYLDRYWGRQKGEDRRKCPTCGRAWRTKHPLESPTFWLFPFQCKKCRLVSHLAVDYDDQRHAVIGEFRKKGN
jgi:predicted  nucleic acid-binding Zn ribbon protein